MSENNANWSHKIPKLYTTAVREIAEDDAKYIFSLRTDAGYSKYISKVSDDVEDQRNYIRAYLADNANKRKSYYLILLNNLTGKRCGTVRLYNFNLDCFEWGSWILDHNKPRYAAMETGILVYEFAFEALGFSKSEFEVNKKNERVVDYHLKSGAEIINQDATNLYFRISKPAGLTFAHYLRTRLEKKLA